MSGVKRQKRKVRYRLYIDESGDHAYSLLDRPDHRYLALLGVWFRQDEDYVPFCDEMETFKRRVFGPRPDRPVILHRSAIINRKGPFGVLRDSGKQEQFNAGLLELARNARFRLIIVVIDKRMHLDTYTSPDHPYHYCLSAMLDRYSGYLNFKNAVGDVVAESRGKEEDLQLGVAYRRVYDAGTYMYGHEHHQRALTSNKIKIQPKYKNLAGLQLADIFAHPVKQAMLRQERLIAWEPSEFAKKLLEIARQKVNRQEYRGHVNGYGAVWLPKRAQ